MQTRFWATPLAAAGLLAGVTAAQADLKVSQTVTVQNPQFQAAMQSMSPQQKAQMARIGVGGNIQSTLFVSGQRFRTDVGQITSVLVDRGAKTVTTLNRLSHTYSRQSLQSAVAGANVGNARVKPTGKTKVILGHLCRDYHVSASDARSGGTISGDIWAAPDLPRLPVGSGPGAALQGLMGKVGGMPLQITFVLTGGAMGDTTIKTRATSISTAPLPASTFAVPAGYNPGPAGMNPGMGGGAMGGAMGQ